MQYLYLYCLNNKIMSPRIVFLIRTTVAVLFILFGIYVLVLKDKINLESPYNYLFSLLLLVYGMYRLYRAKNNYDENA